MSHEEIEIFIAASYPDLETANHDFQAVKDHYYEINSLESFDAAVIGRQDTGRIKILKKHEQPTPYGSLVGQGWGLATGLVVALFPDAALGTGFLVGSGPAYAGIGAICGTVSRELGWETLRTLGEHLESAHAGMVAVATTAEAPALRLLMSRAENLELGEAVIDVEALEKDIRDAYREAVA